eukprot:GFUD01043440.1.p1 GENE.GFUD01043440.1~~GFUD01043440.1.p1  ORF type:complete len:233 (+),score=77.66 GFUD01043440.1:3-701(+)
MAALPMHFPTDTLLQIPIDTNNLNVRTENKEGGVTLEGEVNLEGGVNWEEEVNIEEIEVHDKSTSGTKQRTEPLWAISCFVHEEKQKIGPKCKLNMSVVDKKWKMLTPDQREPYEELSKQDRQSLGANYRMNRKRKKTSPMQKNKENAVVVINDEQDDEPPDAVSEDKQEDDEPSSMTNMLEEFKVLEEDVRKKTLLKHEQDKDLLKLKVDTERKVKEISELDNLVASFQLK